MKANYEEDKVIVSATEPTGLDRKKVWIKKGKNLIKQIILNSMCDSNGLIYNNQPNFARTDYIPIEHNVDYIFSHSLGSGTGYISTFDKNFNYLGKINAEEITTKFNISDINVKYIIISIWSPTIEEDINIMLEQNSTETDYEPYIEKEIYVKNDNGVFERFYKDNGIIDSGSNDNFKYIKFSDGTLIQYATIIFNNPSWNQWGSLYYAECNVSQYKFPVPFIDKPVVNGSIAHGTGSGDGWISRIGGTSTTDIESLAIARPTTYADSMYVNITAIGRWK